MSAVDFGGVFAVDNHGFVLGDVLIREVNHDILALESRLQCADIDARDRHSAPQRKHSRLARRLTGENCGRNDSDEIPARAGSVGRSARGYDVRIVRASKTSERNLEEMIPVFKVVDRAD